MPGLWQNNPLASEQHNRGPGGTGFLGNRFPGQSTTGRTVAPTMVEPRQTANRRVWSIFGRNQLEPGLSTFFALV
eukprot:1839592-Amphidinium_carterae.3